MVIITVQDDTTLSVFNPHGGPITNRSQDRKLTLLNTLLPKIFLALDLICNSRATFLVIYSGIRRNTYSRALKPFHLLIGHRTIAYPLDTSYYTFLLGSRCVSFDQLERYPCVHSWDNPRWLTLIAFYHFRTTPYLFVSTRQTPKKGCDFVKMT